MLKATIVRVLAFAALFAYVLPFGFNLAGFGSSFAFTGGIVTALGLGVAYMAAMFVVLGVFALVLNPLNLTVQQRKDMWPLSTAVFLAVTVACLMGADLVPLLALTVSGWLAALIGGAVAIGVMYATMPLTSSK